MRSWRITALVVVTAFASAATAEETNVKHAREDLSLKEKAQKVGEKCGVAPKTTIDWKTFPADYGNYSVSGYCGSVLDGLWTACNNGKAKKAYVKKTLKSFTCKYGEKGKRALRSKKGNITLTVDLEASNYDQWVRRELLRSF